MNYEIEFGYYYQLFDNFKDRDSLIMINSISQSRIGQYMGFESYANISFDETDKLKRYGHVTSLESFDKKKANCLVYNLPASDMNDGRYNKIFLYWHQGKMDSYYGYILHNSETGNNCQIADVSGDLNDIMISLNKTIYGLKKAGEWAKMLEYKRDQEKQFRKRRKY